MSIHIYIYIYTHTLTHMHTSLSVGVFVDRACLCTLSRQHWSNINDLMACRATNACCWLCPFFDMSFRCSPVIELCLDTCMFFAKGTEPLSHKTPWNVESGNQL